MSPQFLTIAYFTQNEPYQTLAQNFEKSAKKFNLPVYIEAIQDQGSWEKNTHYKAYFIKKCLNEKNQNLLYVDIDAIFKLYPELIDTLDCDLAYRTENFRWRKDEALSGTIYLKNCPLIKSFMDRWIQINESRPSERMKPETWEQANMKRAHLEFTNLKYFNLPPEYTFIFDIHRQMFPKLNPVIEHYQASREVFRRGNNLANRNIIQNR